MADSSANRVDIFSGKESPNFSTVARRKLAASGWQMPGRNKVCLPAICSVLQINRHVDILAVNR